MALVVEETVEAGTTGTETTLTLTFASAPEDQLLVLDCMTKSSTLTNPTGFTTAIEVLNAGNSDILRQAYIVCGAAEDNTPTWTNISAGDGCASHGRRVSGINPDDALDQTASDGYTAAQTSQVTGTTATLEQAAEIAIAAAGLRESVTSPAIDSSFIDLQQQEGANGGTNLVTILSAYKIVAATTAISGTFSWTNNAGTMGLVATYKEAAAGGEDITATASVNFSTAADVSATGKLQAAATVAFSPVADINAPGKLTGTAAITFTTVADISARGKLSGTATVTFSPVADIAATGKLSTTGSVTFTTAADLQGATQNNISAAGLVQFTAVAALRARGKLAASTTVVFAPAALLIDGSTPPIGQINNPGALSGTVIRGALSASPTRGAVSSSTVRRAVPTA